MTDKTADLLAAADFLGGGSLDVAEADRLAASLRKAAAEMTTPSIPSDEGLVNCTETMIEDANERIRTVFAETAILLTHPDERRRALAKERVYAVMFAEASGHTALLREIEAKDDALRSIREHCAVQPSALAKAIVATCDAALSRPLDEQL